MNISSVIIKVYVSFCEECSSRLISSTRPIKGIAARLALSCVFGKVFCLNVAKKIYLDPANSVLWVRL